MSYATPLCLLEVPVGFCRLSCGFPCEKRSVSRNRGSLWGRRRRLSMFWRSVGHSWQCGYTIVYTSWILSGRKISRAQREIREWWASWENVNENQNNFLEITCLLLFLGWIIEGIWKGLDTPSNSLIWEWGTEWQGALGPARHQFSAVALPAPAWWILQDWDKGAWASIYWEGIVVVCRV